MLIDLDTGELPSLAFTAEMRADGWHASIEQADSIGAISELSGHMGHKLSVARRKGRFDPIYWRDMYRLLHARRDALLTQLAEAEATAKALPDAFG